MLSISGLDVAYGQSQVLWGVDLERAGRRAGLPHGTQRRRQDHVAQDHDRALAGARRTPDVRRIRHHEVVARPAGAGRHRLRAARARDLPASLGRGESPDGAARLRPRRLPRRTARPLPGAQAAAGAQGRRALGRRAADARDRTRLAHQAEAAHARRADRRHPALDHPRDRRGAPAHQGRAQAGRPPGRAVP